MDPATSPKNRLRPPSQPGASKAAKGTRKNSTAVEVEVELPPRKVQRGAVEVELPQTAKSSCLRPLEVEVELPPRIVQDRQQ